MSRSSDHHHHRSNSPRDDHSRSSRYRSDRHDRPRSHHSDRAGHPSQHQRMSAQSLDQQAYLPQLNYHEQYEAPHYAGTLMGPPIMSPFQVPNFGQQINFESHGNMPPHLMNINIPSFPPSPLDRLQLPPDRITETGIIPNNPYYELPAGLMVPLVPADRREYKPLKPEDLRLPFPKFPDENFLKMIDSYYRSDSNRRDIDGWDRAFVDTFLAQKEILATNNSSKS